MCLVDSDFIPARWLTARYLLSVDGNRGLIESATVGPALSALTDATDTFERPEEA